jgi:hypothetical protein
VIIVAPLTNTWESQDSFKLLQDRTGRLVPE